MNVPDVVVVYVMAANQVNAKSVRFIEELALDRHVLFVQDPGSSAIRRLDLLKRDAEAIERGVPHPSTYVLDRRGLVRFADVRTDYHRWLDSELVVEALGRIP